MGERPRCAFWNFSAKSSLADESQNCARPAWNYRFHGEPGEEGRLALYCTEHTYRDQQCREITPEIRDRARAEGWPFMPWPVPRPKGEDAVAEELESARVLLQRYSREDALLRLQDIALMARRSGRDVQILRDLAAALARHRDRHLQPAVAECVGGCGNIKLVDDDAWVWADDQGDTWAAEDRKEPWCEACLPAQPRREHA